MAKKLIQSEIKQPLKILQESNLRKDLPEDFVNASRHWSLALKDIESYLCSVGPGSPQAEVLLASIKSNDAMNLVDGVLKKSCWAWAPSGRTVRFNETDRMGQHFFGAMYTSRKHEWPHHDGCPFKPFAQISLDHASEVAGADVGSGLLQLFETGSATSDGYFLRHIPAEEVSEALLTPLPDIDDTKAQKIKDRFVWDADRFFGETSECIHVEAFSDRFISTKHEFGTSMEADAVHQIADALRTSGESSLQTAAIHLEAINPLLVNLSEDMGDRHFDLVLFGLVEPIQTEYWEMPDPLINFGGCRRTISGWQRDSAFDVYGDGSGQIYLESYRRGELKYRFYGDR